MEAAMSPEMRLWSAFVDNKSGKLALMSKEFRVIAQAYHAWILEYTEPKGDYERLDPML